MKFPLLVSSVSILLDNTRELELFQNFKTEAAVHSQALNIYVFIHLTATNTSRNIWEELQKIYLKTLSENKENSYNGLQKFSHQRNLERETNYLQSVIRADECGASVVPFYWNGFASDGLLEFAALHHYSTDTAYLAVEYSRFWIRREDREMDKCDYAKECAIFAHFDDAGKLYSPNGKDAAILKEVATNIIVGMKKNNQLSTSDLINAVVDLEIQKSLKTYIEKWKQIFKNYIKTSFELGNLEGFHLLKNSKINYYNISKIYLFIDIAFYDYIRSYSSNIDLSMKEFVQPGSSKKYREVKDERLFIDFLRTLVRECREEFIKNHCISELMKDQVIAVERFIFIGIDELTNLLVEIENKNKDAITKFIGDRFTYDEPKFIDSILRIARKHNSFFTNQGDNLNPLLRVDDDVIITARAVKRIMDEYNLLLFQKKESFFFSGTYGLYLADIPFRNKPHDHFALRCHFFYDPIEGEFNYKLLNLFFSDFSLLGAPQYSESVCSGNPKYKKGYSSHLKELIQSEKIKKNSERKESQLISGGGLVSSSDIMESIPPFMNFLINLMWVDDFLRRVFAERLGFVKIEDIESIEDAKMDQVRHPDGITADNIAGSPINFQNVLNGVLFYSLLTQSDLFIDKINSLIGKGNFTKTDDELKKNMKDIFEKNYNTILYAWSSHEYKGTILYSWSITNKCDIVFKNSIIDNLISNTMQYIELVSKWKTFVIAAKRYFSPGIRLIM